MQWKRKYLWIANESLKVEELCLFAQLYNRIFRKECMVYSL